MSGERVHGVPPDFGGFVSAWHPQRRVALLIRVGKGHPQEEMSFTPLNLLQARATIDVLIKQGTDAGYITEEHLRQAAQLPVVEGLDNIPPRSRVDDIAGPG